jgi:hypothetical protein
VSKGKEHILATLSRRGDLLGEMALLGGEQRPGTATALQPTVMVEMKRMDFERALQQRPVPGHRGRARSHATPLMQVVHPPAHVRSTGKVFILMGALPPKDRLGFALNLALSTLEQTRRRVLLVEVTEDSAEPAVSHLSRKTRGIPDHMDLEDFQSVEGYGPWRWPTTQDSTSFPFRNLCFKGDFSAGSIPWSPRLGKSGMSCSFPCRADRPGRPGPFGKKRIEPCMSEKNPRKKAGLFGEKWRALSPPTGVDLVELQRNSSPRRNRPGRFYVPWRRRDWTGGRSFRHVPGQRRAKRVGPHGPAPGRACASGSPWGPARRWGIRSSEFCGPLNGTEFIPTSSPERPWEPWWAVFMPPVGR